MKPGGHIVDAHGRPYYRAAAGGGGYAGAAANRRFRHLHVSDTGPNAMLAGEGGELRARSRHFTRNSPHAAAARRSYEINAVGAGMRPRSLHPDEETAAKVTALWGEWQEQSDALGADDFYGLQALAAAAEFDSGEVLIRRRRRLRGDGLAVPFQVQLIEADLLPYHADGTVRPAGRNRVIAGVEVNGIGRPVAYHLHREHPRDQAGAFFSFNDQTLRRVPAEDVLHVYQPPRPGALRGTPLSAPVLQKMWQLQQADDAELDGMGMRASMTGTITPAVEDGGLLPVGSDATKTPDADNAIEITLEPNTLTTLAPGDAVNLFQTQYPAGAYRDFMELQVHSMAAGWGVPYEQITNDLRGVNFSSIRAGLIVFYRQMRTVQRRFKRQFYGPVWGWFIDEAFAAGVLVDEEFPANRADYLAVVWRPDGFDWVDPKKEAEAIISQWKAGLISAEQAMEALGYDPRETKRLIEEERAAGFGPREQGAKKKKPGKDDRGDAAGTAGAAGFSDVKAADVEVVQ